MSAAPSPVDPPRNVGVTGRALRHARRLIVLVVGISVLAIGTALIVLPGPAFVVIPVGLAILGTEFVWARHFLQHLKDRARNLVGKGPSEATFDR